MLLRTVKPSCINFYCYLQIPFVSVNLMPNSNTSHNIPHTDWQMLGELKLPAGLSTDGAIHAWLKAVLDPLQLQTDFLHTIMISAQGAAARDRQVEAAREFEHIHFIVYILLNHESNTGTWGFFRIEKFRDATDDTTTSAHSVELYLYLEGE